ncbi:MAG: polysaccharide deacetylase family protein [Anaerolineae bacterium]
MSLRRILMPAGLVLFWLVVSLVNLHCSAAVAEIEPATVTPFPSATATDAPTTTLTPTNSPTPTLTETDTETPTSTPTSTATVTSTPTGMPTRTATAIPVPLVVSTPARTVQIPILLYHYIRPYPDRAIDPLGYTLSVPLDLFSRELDYLQGQGYQTMRLADLARFLRDGAPPLPAKPMILTFDDGYADAYSAAFPALKAHGMIGTFFVVPGFVDQGLANYVTWDEVKEMHAAGMEIGAHTMHHVDLTAKSPAAAEQEVAESQLELQQALGEPVRVFAYPYGRMNLWVEQIVARYFDTAATTIPGTHQTSDIPYRLHRIEISGAFNFPSFVGFLDYWLGNPR